MNEADGLVTAQAGSVVTEEKFPSLARQKFSGAPGALDGAEARGGLEREPERGEDDSAEQLPLLAPPGRDPCWHGDTAATLVQTDGPGQETSVQPELESDDTDRPCLGGRVRGESSSLQGEECPICTEPYDVECGRRMVLLNCDHTLCRGCLASILKRAVDPSRVQCPLCRQKTPILHWEIQRMQEEIVYCSGVYGPGQMEEDSLTEPESTPRLCPGLEERLLSRVGPVRLCGCCLRPPGLVQGMGQVRGQCRCCYLALLMLLVVMELACLLVVFLPVVVLILLFSLMSK